MDSASSSSSVDTGTVPHQNENNNNNNAGQESRFIHYYAIWMAQQEEDLEELNRAMASGYGPENEVNLREVAQRVMDHFQEYLDKRSEQAGRDSPCLFCPSWCSTFERSNLWMGGCRAAMSIRLVHAMRGMEAEASMMDYLRGVRIGNMADLSTDQISLINTLQAKVIQEENRISSQMATLHENIADEPFLSIVNYSAQVGEFNMDVQRAIESHAVEMGNLLKEADMLRMDTLKDLLQILTPYQGVDLLVTTKKLHLSLPQWSMTRDEILANT